MKIQTSLRLDQELIESLKGVVKKQNTSLNNLIETLLYKVVDIPNNETKQAIYEAENNINLTKINDLQYFLNDI